MKNGFLNNNDIGSTYDVILHTSTQKLHKFCFTQNALKLFLYKRMKFISIKGNDEYDYECPCLADVLQELHPMSNM